MKKISFGTIIASIIVMPTLFAQLCEEGEACQAATPIGNCHSVSPIIGEGNLPLDFVRASNHEEAAFYAFSSNASVTVNSQGTAILALTDDSEDLQLSVFPFSEQALRVRATEMFRSVKFETE